jgi:hypothetical protein
MTFGWVGVMTGWKLWSASPKFDASYCSFGSNCGPNSVMADVP